MPIGHRVEAAAPVRRLAIAGAEETEDMYAAIDLVVDRLDRRIDQTRERRREPRRSAGA
ncbi:MAG TPA: ribosome-associated translation inhibitor RaiA [Thermodesulfobacteriota bacterium]